MKLVTKSLERGYFAVVDPIELCLIALRRMTNRASVWNECPTRATELRFSELDQSRLPASSRYRAR